MCPITSGFYKNPNLLNLLFYGKMLYYNKGKNGNSIRQNSTKIMLFLSNKRFYFVFVE